MASLNLSINGPSIKSSYQGVINGPALSSSSPTTARWALFTVQAPLVNAFQNTGSKESILKVDSTGDGELADLVEDFSEGRIQFAFVRVKDPNTGLPKNVFIAWCGGGVPERTKGYFTSHSAAVAKILHGYHVQITARSDDDLVPQEIIQKVADASGAKYSAAESAPDAAAAPPPVAKKPVFTPTTSSRSVFNPTIAARSQRQTHADDDGWGADAPPVTRTEIQKVESAYKPTKVDIASLRRNNDDSRFNGPSKQDDSSSDVVRGGYQPVGKVDIAALRAQAKQQQDDRPTIVKGAYEPVGKVDIAAIRARAQRPAEKEEEPQAPPKSLADRSAAFTQSERLTELPKPKVAKAFGSTPFTGTKAPTPVGMGYGAPSPAVPPPTGSASRTFADQGGKTPAQLWAERKAKQGGAAPSPATPAAATPITSQKSGSEWKSGYAGKSWAAVQTSNYGRGGVEKQTTGGTERSDPEPEPQQPMLSGGGVSAMRDRFKGAAPMGTTSRAAPSHYEEEEAPPRPPPVASRPAGGFVLPGLPSRPAAANQDEEDEELPPSIPSRNYEERDPSPVRVAMPVPRSAAPEIEPPVERLAARPVPVPQELPKERDIPAERETHDPRAAAIAVAAVGGAAVVGGGIAAAAVAHAADDEPSAPAGPISGRKAVIQYDYEKAEDNEIELREGAYVTNIEMVDDDWWMGTNEQGESGLFPSNYVELVEGDEEEEAAPPPPPAPVSAPSPAPASASALPAAQEEEESAGHTATAQFDYEAAEDNELSFPEGATITNLEFPDEDWWFGHYQGASGLFPANYVEVNQ
ncbi:actin binding protein [Collariella sp. IMI 366227]|nr:actin binding protein [Collariella sp. IMI 366227]